MRAVFLCLLLIAACSCASAGKSKNLVLYPETSDRDPDGYSRSGRNWVFDNKSIIITVHHVGPLDPVRSPLLEELAKNNYVLLEVAIENKGKTKSMFNPALAALDSDEMDYRKPLDFTDFYEMFKESPEMKSKLASVKERFYDLTVTLQPGEKTTRILVFSPLSKEARSAELLIKNLYIGTDTINIRFPFRFKEHQL